MQFSQGSQRTLGTLEKLHFLVLLVWGTLQQ